MKEEKTEDLEVKAKPKIKPLTPEQKASRRLAHEIKVANFLNGGEF